MDILTNPLTHRAARGLPAARNILEHTATHCNTLQHTATHCNTLQHTATHRIRALCVCGFVSAEDWFL